MSSEIVHTGSELLQSYDQISPRLEELQHKPHEGLRAAFRWVHTAKSAFGFLEAEYWESQIHRFEDWLQDLKQNPQAVEASNLHKVREGLDFIYSAAEQLSAGEIPPSNPAMQTWTDSLLNSFQQNTSVESTLKALEDVRELLETHRDQNDLPEWLGGLHQSLHEHLATMRTSVNFALEVTRNSLLMESASYKGEDISALVRRILAGFEDIIAHGSVAEALHDEELQSAYMDLIQRMDPQNSLRLVDWVQLPSLLETMPEILEDIWKGFWHGLLSNAEIQRLSPAQLFENRPMEPNPPTNGMPAESQGVESRSGESIRLEYSSLDAFTRSTEKLIMNRNYLYQIEREVRPQIRSELSMSLRHGLDGLQTAIDELYAELVAIRGTRLSELYERLERVGRQLLRESGKDFKLELSGHDVSLDRLLLPLIAESLVHLLRNAVDHGLEFPSERESQGKAQQGTIRVCGEARDKHLFLEIGDDGRGIDASRVLQKAREKGLVSGEEDLRLEEVFQLLLMPGFSTASEVSRLSGRGVGLDVVANMLQNQHGTMQIHSTFKQGSQFQITLPLVSGIATHRLLLLRVGTTMVAMKEERIIEAIGTSSAAFTDSSQSAMLFRSAAIPVACLSRVLYGEVPQNANRVALVVDDSRGERFALLADALDESIQAVVEVPEIRVLKENPLLEGSLSIGTRAPVLVLNLKLAKPWFQNSLAHRE